MLLPDDFKEFLKLLNAHEVQYLLIGGYAVGYHGYPRTTNDIDFWIAINPENAGKIVNVLREFGFDGNDLSDGLFLKEQTIIRLGMPPVRIEISTGISGVKFDECYPNREKAVLDGVDVAIIGKGDLIKNKKASGRLKDLADLQQLT